MSRGEVSVILAALVLTGCASARVEPTARIGGASELRVRSDPALARHLEALRSVSGVPRVAAAILRRGNELSVAAAGRRRIDQKARLTPADAFHLGSDTKAMTASMVARLVDRGILRWDETLSYVPTEEDNPPLIGPAGTVNCTLEAWARFARAHAHADHDGWLTRSSLAHLHEGYPLAGAPPGKDVGLGWGVTQTDPARLTHSGSNGYNVAEIVVIPDRHAAMMVVCNAGDERARALSGNVRDLLVEQLLGEVATSRQR